MEKNNAVINDGYSAKGKNTEQLIALCAELRAEIESAVTANGGHLASNLGSVELTVALHNVFDFSKDKLIFDVGHQSYAHKLLSGRSLVSLRKLGGIGGFLNTEESTFDAVNSGHAGAALSQAIGFARAREMSGDSYSVVAVIGDGAFANGMVWEALHDLDIGRLLIVVNDNGYAINRTENVTDYEALCGIFGINYLGECNGHDIGALCKSFSTASTADGVTLIRAMTVKGKGNAKAETEPTQYHSVTSESLFSRDVGTTLCKMAERDSRIVAITAGMTAGTGLTRFEEEYPNRFFDVGISEEHAVTMAATMARQGYLPYVAIYATFLQRAYDQIIQELLPDSLPVTLLVDHAGLVSGDGESHQGVYAFGMLNGLEPMKIYAPASSERLCSILESSVSDCPTAYLYPKAAFENNEQLIAQNRFERDYSTADVVVLTTGAHSYANGYSLCGMLKRLGIPCALKNLDCLKPLTLPKLSEYKLTVVVEDNKSVNGVGQTVLSLYDREGIHGEVLRFGVGASKLPAATIEQLDKLCGISPQDMFEAVKKKLR